MAYITKYRPTTLGDVKGNAGTIASIESILDSSRSSSRAHGWMLVGPSGCGKTTIARLIAAEIGATGAGVVEADAAHYRGIDPMKQLLATARYKTPGSPVTVYILDECHQLTKEAQNILLKTLEEPPGHVYFILCTTEPEKVLTTIQGRCLLYRVESLNDATIDDLIGEVAEAEGLELTDDVADAIIEMASGSPRLALGMLQKVSNCSNDLAIALPLLEAVINERTLEGPIDEARKIVNMLIGKERSAWAEVARALDRYVVKPVRDESQGGRTKAPEEQVRSFRRALIGVLGRMILSAPDAWMAEAILLLEDNLYGPATRGGLVARVHKIWTLASGGSRGNPSSERTGRQRPSGGSTRSELR